MENTKRDMKRHADLIKKFVLTEAEKIRAYYGKECGNCVEPASSGADLGKVEKVKEDNGITTKIEMCDTCEKEPCTCEKEHKIEEVSSYLKHEILRVLKKIK